jgi:hypothetical protein
MNYRLELFSILFQFMIVKLYQSFTAPPTKKEANCTPKPDQEQTRTENLPGSLGTRNPHTLRTERTEGAILSGKAKYSSLQSTVHYYVVFTRKSDDNHKLK